MRRSLTFTPGRSLTFTPGRSRAFTLVELLVALAIFALLSTFAYRSLAVMLDGREALDRDSRKWRDLALFVGRFERDVQAALDRPATGPSGTLQAPVSSLLDLGGGAATGLALTRSGAALYANALSAPQRVGYRLAEGRVERLSWPGVDAGPRAEPVITPVLEDARALAFRFMDRNLEWRRDWALPASQGLPLAVEMTVELAGGERIVRVVDIPR
ncbi:MAG: type II secretion system minor pseudopilin GspJ [Burkholderiales bacterium]|nr:type II secretion system minor pseudopilin GspJ [Burkholderiales bacterium]